MKTFQFTLILCLVCVLSALPADSMQQQMVDVESGGGTLTIQRQNTESPMNQIVRVNKGGGVLVIQWNGKVKAKKDKNTSESTDKNTGVK